MPDKTGKPAQQSPAAALSPQVASRRILVVEDQARLREMLQASIIEMGMSASVASSAETALRLISREFFAVAVVDLNLPGMDGLAFCEQLATLKPHTQMIILTGFGDLDAARKAIRLQVVDFLTKPCSMDDLENAINRARLRWLDRWAGGGLEAETQLVFPQPEPAPAPIIRPPTAPAEKRSIDEMERQLILDALSRHVGNRQAAAMDLGISVRKLYYRIREYQRAGLM
jgi:DNA-binding NtrC family response regulator